MPPATKWAIGVLVFAVLLIFRVEFLLWEETKQTVRNFVGETVFVEGVVSDDPDTRDASVRVHMSVETIDGEEAKGTLIASLPVDTELHYGDRVAVRGTLEAPKAFETTAGRTFDYPTYLRVRGVVATIPFATLEAQEIGRPSLLRGLFAFKHRFEQSLEQTIAAPQVNLLEGILLGERGGFSPTLLQLFVTVGLIHVVVLSGSNISIVGEGVFRALGFLPRTLRYVVGGAALVLFVLMTGSGAAAVRALVMGGIGLVARYMRRPELALRALGVAATLMLLHNPLLVLDSGFALSVLATFGLITISPYIETKLPFVPAWKRFNLRSIAASTIAVEIYLLPALLYYSGVFSLVALPVNMLVLPSVWLIMFAGFLAGLLGLFHPLLALLPAFVADVLLRVMLFVTQVAGALPFAATTIAAFPLWIAVAVYVPLTFIASKLYRNAPRSLSNSDF